MSYDILLKNGTIVNGTGAKPFIGDIAIKDGRIAAIGPNIGAQADEVIDASGKYVTPGFVDPHTHYDGQVTWDRDLMPTAGHGVTTIVIGSCGIGFAPVRKGTEDWLITLTEGVEDIPGSALHVGIPLGWESFPDYLDTLASNSCALDIAAHVPHSAVRAYVLGKRAETDEPATDADLAEMASIVSESIAAGAVGLATSRVYIVFSPDFLAGMPAFSFMLPRRGRLLGGKSAAIVLDDFDPAKLGPLLAPQITMMCGQVCINYSRVLVPRAKHDDYVDSLAAAMAKIKVGNPLEDGIYMGPVAMKRHSEANRLTKYRAGIKRSIDELPSGW